MKELIGQFRLLPQVMIMTSLILCNGQVYSNEGGEQGFNNLSLVGESALEEMRAGDVGANPNVQSIQNLQATVTGGDFNADAIINGSVTIGEHAFDNFGGIGLVVGNTGNNNAIDAALGVTFHLQ